MLTDYVHGAAPIAPLLKWPGGKRRLVQFILPLLPKRFNSYYEPFLGGGALFFALQPATAFLSDRNSELVATYNHVRSNPESVIEQLASLPNTETDYYAIRSRRPTSGVARAARLIYLTTLAFNGIHRVNFKGQFNVPYGYKGHLKPCEPDRIRAISQALRTATVKCVDFEVALSSARTGDLVYLDPPYTVAHGNNGFLKYNAKIFSWEDQQRLAKVARRLAKKSCFVVVSNADHPTIRALYPEFEVAEVRRYSVMAASSDFRRRIVECIFYNRPSPNA